ncbi:MAG: HPP family protein [Acidimicrobiales bacterium]
MAGVGILLIGIADRMLALPFLTPTLGPTAYVFAAHPHTSTGKLRNAVIGHAVGIGAGLVGLATFGLWNAPSSVIMGHSSWAQAGASALAIAITLALLHLAKAHHAPAAATTLLIATGVAPPGRPLIGLVLGLVGLMVLSPLLAAFPLLRRDPE